MATSPKGRERVTAPSDWQGWQRWVENVDWSDWRSWLRRVAFTDWAAGPPTGTPWQRTPEVSAVSLTVRAYEEDEPGDRVREQLAATWPAFHRWWREGANTRPATGQARARLKEHMPELVPTWERLTTMIPGSRDAGAALALWNPPPFLTGCSQAAVLDGGPALIRNYDWDYRLFDGVVAKTAYTGRRVLGMVDCLCGLLDGVNDAGLAVSLTFGGRPQVGEGFGIPLVIRYVLEVRGTVDEAVQVLRRVPVHMSYNVTVLDRVASGPPSTSLRTGRPVLLTGRWPPTTRAAWNGPPTPRRSAAWSGNSGSGIARPLRRRSRPHRGLPAPTPLRHPLPPRLRDALHRRVPACRRDRALPLATAQVGAVAGQHQD